MAAPNAYEQLMMELINRGRSDPFAEAARYGISLNQDLASGTISGVAKQPLAFNPLLVNSARAHSQWMLDTDTFSHTGAGGSSAGDRMASAGYVFTGSWTWGENIAWQGTTGSINKTAMIHDLHEGLFLSSGHRTNLMNNTFRELGIGEKTGVFTTGGTDYNAMMVTQNFAKSGTDYFLSGVVYDDTNGNDFYSVGEGRGAVNIALARVGGGTTNATSWSAGGYTRSFSASDTYDITFSGGGLAAPVTVRTMLGGSNAKVDLVDGNTIQTSVGLSLESVSGRNIVHLGRYGGESEGNNIANSLLGGRGDDIFHGNGGGDVIRGSSGQDRLFGDNGNDSLFGNDGRDVLVGGTGNDSLAGGTGADTLRGNAGRDTLAGHAGSDSLSGGGWSDWLIGGDGNDQLYGNYGGDLLEGGSDHDTLGGGAGGDTLRGEDGRDTLWGGGGNDVLNGGDWSDLLNGGENNDTLRGGGGADTLNDGNGDDILYGGLSSDRFVIRAGTDIIKDYVDGTDKIEILNAANFGDLIIGSSGGDATVTVNGDPSVDLTVESAAGQLSASDFIF